MTKIRSSDQAVSAPTSQPQIDSQALLASLPFALIVVDADDQIRYSNPTAEQFFALSSAQLSQQPLQALLPPRSPLLDLVTQVRTSGASMSEYELDLSTPRIGHREASASVAPVYDNPALVQIALREHSMARKLDRQLAFRGSARTVSAMAAMLVHEVKNPLSGIRGAAQLIEPGLREQDRALGQLIRQETDRICALIDRMDIFTDQPAARAPVNIHQVLERVRQIAANGFGKNTRFIEDYDPSLPSVYGNMDQMIQIFLNLVKNAVEAAPKNGAEVTLRTAFRHGVHVAVPGVRQRMQLPIEVSVRDNGPGISEDLRKHLFEPFVTNKASGSGLGLALVAKLVGDHGGTVSLESVARGTTFRVLLPMAQDDEMGAASK